MMIKRLILSVIALLPVSSWSARASIKALDMDELRLRQPFDGDIALARQMLFPKGQYEISIEESRDRFLDLLDRYENNELSDEERESLFEEAIELLKSNGFLKDREIWLSQVPSSWW